ncbi:hypothetical protein F1559_000365 [Cyanidiococcus yangmingshanensis]|uniref:Uncharacterized protein n=1 Tax=Cyanidiococcus yangmingshanensis TaxID=2690220 RepID=A0A7J7IKI0_9RHOD|nr:hypothetical protein F1559_000365 [Cyanidiococcus yangmingshanensis]
MGTPSSHSESERLALQRKVLVEKFGLTPEPGEPAPTLASAKTEATLTTTLGRPCPPGRQSQSGAHSSDEASSPRTPSVIQIDQASEETDARELIPDPDRDYGLRLQGNRFCYRASVHEQARAPRELLTVTPVTVYASSFEESTARRIAVHDNWIAYAVKNHIRLLYRRQGQRALLKGHEGAVEDLAIAPQCPRVLLSAATDGSIILWRLDNWDAEPSSPTEQIQWQTQLSSRRSLRVALSPDARWVAFTEDAQVHVLPLTSELTTDSSQRITIPSTHEVRDVVFVANTSSTGWRLIIASAHGMVLIAEPESGTIVGEFSAHGGVPVERVFSLAPNVIVTAAEHCSELWYWRLVGHWTQKSTGSVHLLARCSFRELPGFGVIAADPQGEFIFFANSGTKQLFILHHGSSTHTPDYLVQVPLRHAVLSCCATRSIRRERDLDENSGLPQVRELVELDLWCVHEKTIQAYHGRREDLIPVVEPGAMETWTETSDEERPRSSERVSDAEHPTILDAAMSTSPPVLLTHTHTLYETFRRIAPQLSQRSVITDATSSETDAVRDVSNESVDRSPMAVTLDTRVDSLRAPLTPTINATKTEDKAFAVGSSIAMASLERTSRSDGTSARSYGDTFAATF